MKTFFQFGAMYAVVDPGEIQAIPVTLGDETIHPGEFVRKLGHKARTSFEMHEGYYLRYVGQARESEHLYLLFAVNNHRHDDGIYYAFGYVDRNTLIIGGRNGCRDIVIEHLEKFTEINVEEQLTLWEVAD